VDKNEALSELAVAYGAVALSLIPNPVAAIRLWFARNSCRIAGLSDQEINTAIAGFRDCAREAVKQTFPHQSIER
jgi:hypothetical protein